MTLIDNAPECYSEYILEQREYSRDVVLHA